jgi:uroporphyrinogen-III decarboxylase
MGPQQVLLGNIHPVQVVRDGTPDDVMRTLDECYRAAAPNYIVGAGCEIPRGTPHENVRAMIRFAREH